MLGRMIGRTYSVSGTKTAGGYLNKIEADACCMDILGYIYPTNLITQCQATNRNYEISKMELRKLDTEWETKDSGEPEKRKIQEI